MASGLITSSSPPDTDTPDGLDGSDVRLRLKPAGSTTGYVDGSWWPRSRDLAAELPLLLPAMTARLGRVERVSYHLGDWDPADRRIHVDGHAVRLSGFRRQRSHTIDVLGPHQQITLLVVPPETSPQAADDALAAGGQAGNTDGVDALLSTHSPS